MGPVIEMYFARSGLSLVALYLTSNISTVRYRGNSEDNGHQSISMHRRPSTLEKRQRYNWLKQWIQALDRDKPTPSDSGPFGPPLDPECQCRSQRHNIHNI